MIYQRLTSTRQKLYPLHYCSECADNDHDAQIELALAMQARELEISGEVTDEVCACCKRAIASVPTEEHTYRVEMTVTFAVTVDLSTRSATAAEYHLSKALEGASFEGAEEAVQSTIEDAVECGDAELEEVTACYNDADTEPAKVVPPNEQMFRYPQPGHPQSWPR